MLSEFQIFLTTATSIIVSASPFVIIGVFVATLIKYTRIADYILVHLPKNVVGRRVIISCLGVFMPVCECGNVPVARSFMQKGLSVGESTTFLLAAPVLNPITIYVTFEAFRGATEVVWIRVIGSFLMANLIGFAIGQIHRHRSVLVMEFERICSEDHTLIRSFSAARQSFLSELFNLLSLLAIGACIASFIQSAIPNSTIIAIGQDPFLAIIAMIVLAFVLSICASVDSFFVLAYTHTFHIGAISSFLLAGPMIDIKMLTMLKDTYTASTLIIITALVFLCSFSICLGVYYFI